MLLALVLAGIWAAVLSAQTSDKKPRTSTTDVAPQERDLAAEAAIAEAATTYVSVGDLGAPAVSISSPTALTVPGEGTNAGVASPYPVTLVVSGFTGTVGRLAVRLNNLSHTYSDDLDIVLVAPSGQKVMLMSDAGGTADLEHVNLTFEDGAPVLPDGSQITSGTYSPSDYQTGETLAPPAPAGPYPTSLAAFNGAGANGTWQLYVSDDTNADVGTLFGFTLIISPQINNTTVVAVPPSGTSGTTESSLIVSGITGPITKVTVSLFLAHTFDSDLDISLVGPDNTTVELTTNNGSSSDNYGTGCGTANRTIFDDAATTSVVGSLAPFVGTFRPEQLLAAFNGKSGAAANGTWKLRAVDESNQDSGTLHCWSIAISSDENTVVQPPTGLRVTSIDGNDVTLRWEAPGAGLVPTGYVLEGGVNPGETLASLATGNMNPIMTLTAPTGAFYVRLRAQAGAALSSVSNEVLMFVNLPTAPSPPAFLHVERNGSALGLSWNNTFKGGAPTSLILDVTGAATASIPLGLSQSMVFPGVPAGGYSFRVRAANAGGFSAASDPVSVTFPGACLGIPDRPTNFLVYKIGNTIHAVWEPNTTGDATTSFVLNVTGAFVGSFPMVERTVSGTVGAGTYNFTVAAINGCGTSAPTAVQSVTIP